jgi:hypothetical protein
MFVDHNLNPSPIKPSLIHNISEYWVALTLKILSKALLYATSAIFPVLGLKMTFGQINFCMPYKIPNPLHNIKPHVLVHS